MWFAPFRRTRPAQQDAATCRACAMRGCPQRLADESIDFGDRRNARSYAARQYAQIDRLQCTCLRSRNRGFLV